MSRAIHSNRFLRTLKIATYSFTGLFLSQTIEHYTYKFFVHNPLPTETKNPLWHALIGSATGNVFMGLCVSRILLNMGFERVPTIRVTLLIMLVYMAATYGDYLYDPNFYDKKFYRIIVRDGRELDKDTAAKMRFEQSRVENIQMKKMEQMIRLHHGETTTQENQKNESDQL
mmetsp:Transcript_11640/g.43761  ORF Transcript_11640/g.43761 Transcript_11640/m.43761 type:complete len:172 (-) Transcript_11640:130-645(-)|eukprot:CAMPEP_0117444750 /NCGR_PEP_ID=MMETSP0759-20121206/5415_1 /TAXON_ID=63605 /ORGANISM="Percolomonas cosmopolitus, Strain WS" /LENGTH=171 /DNA_ID=CAMNT_0005236853 /DNA_START=272 /DNA_END=787 /DNA_ORIENTATION=-